ncbi:MAG: PAS domain S-box protein [Acidobacteriota bacterium]
MARDPAGRADFQKMLAAIEKVRGRPSGLEALESSTAASVDWLARCTSILGVGTAVWNHRGHLTKISPTLERMAMPWGTAEGWWAVLVAEVGPRQLASRLGAGVEIDVRLEDPKGQLRSFRLTASGYIGAFAPGDEEPVSGTDMILLVSDTTATEQTQRALQDTEARYSSLFQGSSDGILLHDLEGRILEANPKAVDMLAFEEEQLLAMRVQELHPPSELETALAALGRVERDGSTRFEIEFIRGDGDVFPAEVSASKLQVGGRETVQAMVRDIAARKASEEQLRESEARKSAMLETALDCIITIDHRGRILEFNPAAEATFGHRREDVLGKRMSELLLPEEYRDAHRQGMARYIKTRKPRVLGQRLELPALRSDGQKLLMEVSITPLPTSDDKPIFVGYMRDITARKEAEERMSQALGAAREANLAKTHFLASMSHELRTPLNVISGMTELAQDEMHEGDIDPYLDAIRSSASSLLNLIDDLLDISRIEAGRFEVNLKPIDFRAFIQETCQSLKHRAESKGLDFRWSVEDTVPPSLVLDKRRLKQVLLNLLSNAIKFTDRGSVALSCSATPSSGDLFELTIEVEDTGIGFDPLESETIFERFAQLRRPSGSRPEGTGLGLAISQALAELMGGGLVADSAKGRGSLFRLRLEAEVAREVDTRPDPEASVPLPKGQSERILLVDDHYGNRVVAARFLERAGYVVREARSGEQALERVRAEPPFDLILMDIEMVGLDGFEATAALRQLDVSKDLPIIALTAHAAKGFRQLCFEADMDDYLSKPINRRDLLEMVARHLGNQQLPATGIVGGAAVVPPTVAGKNDPGIKTGAEPGGAGEIGGAAPSSPSSPSALLAASKDSGETADGGAPVFLTVKSEIRDLIPGFLERCRESAAELASGVGEEHAQRAGHNLKGSGAAYGFPQISTLGGAIEEAAKRGEDWSPRVRELQAFLSRVRFE